MKLRCGRKALAQQLYDTGERTLQQIADLFKVPRTTIYGHLEPGSAAKRLAARNADWQRPPSDGRR